MLDQHRSSSGAVVLRSSLLDGHGIPHAFATRVGGVSSGPFASLNFGNPHPCDERDPAQNIHENFRRLLEAAGAPGREVVEVHQVHGGDVHIVHRGEPAHAGAASTKADAIITADAGRVLAIRTADCAPVLIASSDGGLVAAVHAGWRGVIAGVVPAATRQLRQLGGEHLLAAVGPCLGPDAFEVGPEVAAEFSRVFGDAGVLRPAANGKSLVDLKAALLLQLRACGVGEIDSSDHCTVRDEELFFSHRRERGSTGRMASIIGARERPRE